MPAPRALMHEMVDLGLNIHSGKKYSETDLRRLKHEKKHGIAAIVQEPVPVTLEPVPNALVELPKVETPAEAEEVIDAAAEVTEVDEANEPAAEGKPAKAPKAKKAPKADAAPTE